MDKHVETLRQIRNWTDGPNGWNDEEREALDAAIAALQGIEAAEIRAESAEALASQIRTDWLPANERLAARVEAAEQRVRAVEALLAKWRAKAIENGCMGEPCQCDICTELTKRADELEAALQGTGSGSAGE